MQSKIKGVTLIEILLVLVIIGILIYASASYVQQKALQMRYDRTSTQMQQILNAGLSYYVSNAKWPVTTMGTPELLSVSDLTKKNYLPQNMRSPWNSDYYVSADSTTNLFYVYTGITFPTLGRSTAVANVIAGTLPLGATSSTATIPPGTACDATTGTCYVFSSVNIPGQNINAVGAVNFAGLYHSGACVPVPPCPVDNSGKPTKPEIFLAPAQVSGTYTGNKSQPVPASNPDIYPISAFNTFVTGGPGIDRPNYCNFGQGSVGQGSCGAPLSGYGLGYWRVCIQVVTEKGLLDINSRNWESYQVVMALTRCAISGEKSGSGWNVMDPQM